MNELLQKHGCANVFKLPDGLKELMADISREVLREQPVKIYDFIANYLSALLMTREHGVMALKILDDLCDCRPSVSEHLMKVGMPAGDAKMLSDIIKEEIESMELVEGKEKIREIEIIKKILARNPLDEEMTANVCYIARNAYRDYWYRKKMLEMSVKTAPEESWEKAAQRTLEIYKSTKPSLSELQRATHRIQAAYRGYHVRKQMIESLKPPKQQHAPKVDFPGPPLDIAASREMEFGPVVDIKDKVKTDDMSTRFQDDPQHPGQGTPKTDADTDGQGSIDKPRLSRMKTTFGPAKKFPLDSTEPTESRKSTVSAIQSGEAQDVSEKTTSDAAEPLAGDTSADQPSGPESEAEDVPIEVTEKTIDDTSGPLTDNSVPSATATAPTTDTEEIATDTEPEEVEEEE